MIKLKQKKVKLEARELALRNTVPELWSTLETSLATSLLKM